MSMRALHFYCAYWKFYNVCVRSLFAETIPNVHYDFISISLGMMSYCKLCTFSLGIRLDPFEDIFDHI